MKAPGNWTIEGLFEGWPASRQLFDVIRAYIESMGPVKVEVAKTQVSFGVDTKFAWVWLPQMWIKKANDDSVTLAFDLTHCVEHPHIKSAVEPRPGRWTHHVVINSEADFNDDVKSWLREAHLAALKRGRSAKHKK